MGMSTGRLGLSSGLDDARRDACLHSLGDHYAAGRLSAEELDRRIQVALAAETEADLHASMAGIGVAVPDEAVGAQATPSETGPPSVRARLGRQPQWIAGPGILVAGGTVMAAAGPGSDAAEFVAGLALGALGFLTHWGLSAGLSREPQQARRPSDPPTAGEQPFAALWDDPVPRDHLPPAEDGLAGFVDQDRDAPGTGRAPERVAPERTAPRESVADRAAALRRPQHGFVPGQRTGD